MTKLIVAYENGPDNVSWFDVDDRLILMVLNESEHEQLSDGKKSIHEVATIAEVALEDLINRTSDGKKSIHEVVTIAEVALEDLINRTTVIPNGLDEKGRA